MAVELGMTHHGVGGNLEPSTMGSATQSTMGISATQCILEYNGPLRLKTFRALRSTLSAERFVICAHHCWFSSANKNFALLHFTNKYCTQLIALTATIRLRLNTFLIATKQH